jgi:hypothetical protein
MSALAIDAGDTFALAKLMLDSDEARAAADAQELRDARDTQRQELERQVQQLHEAASDARKAAWVAGSLGVVGGGLATLGTALAPSGESAHPGVKPLLVVGGESLSAIAGPAGTVTFGASEKDAEARAKSHEALAADAGGRAEEAARHRDRVLAEEDRALEVLQATSQSEADGRLALIANA